MAKRSKTEIKTFSAFTQGGARALALFYRDKMGKELLSNLVHNETTGLWEIKVKW